MNDHLQFQVCASRNKDQPYYWRIVAKKNNEVLAHSETMVNKADCVAAIKLVKAYAETASIMDMTVDKPEVIP